MPDLTAVRTRFAPSPTGTLHLGSLRTALFAWLWARHGQGTFVLRIEDTDSRRYVPASVASIMDGLRWLGLEWDEGPDVGGPYAPYTQSQRGDLYRAHADRLLAAGRAYRCFCSPERLQALRAAQKQAKAPLRYDGACRALSRDETKRRQARGEPHTVRLAMPQEGTLTFPDLIRGDIAVAAASLQDPILLKSDGMAVYHLAAVVDDHLMAISHVLRGQEWIATAPYHCQLYAAFGWTPPVMAHLPVILNPHGKGKMSKRHQAPADRAQPVHVHEFRAAGIWPDAMFNFLALLGWTPDASQELFSRQELIDRFDIARISPAAAAMPYDKLNWMNGTYLRALSGEAFKAAAAPFLAQAFGGSEAAIQARSELDYVWPEIQTRVKTLAECPSWLTWAFQTADQMVYAPPDLLIGRQLDAAQSAAVLAAAADLTAAAEPFEPERLHALFAAAAQARGLRAGSFFGPVRGALAGTKVSPPLFAMMAALGRAESLQRLRRAQAELAQRA